MARAGGVTLTPKQHTITDHQHKLTCPSIIKRRSKMFTELKTLAAGAALTLRLGNFQNNLTQGLGFIAVALVYFGAWRPTGIMLGALLFGFVNALVLELKTLEIIPRDLSNIAAMAPAIITILALVFVARRFRAPSALTKPFTRGK